jgi:hypothetical protein
VLAVPQPDEPTVSPAASAATAARTPPPDLLPRGHLGSGRSMFQCLLAVANQAIRLTGSG